MTPLETLASWLEDARRAGMPEPEAMALATADAHAAPSVRIVFCRGIDPEGIVFFTNYESRKGRELTVNPNASVVFHWPVLLRQVRVEGVVARVSAAESDAYFRGRPRGSQLAASVSPQSAPIESVAWLRERQRELEERLGGAEVVRPPGWGGFRLHARAIELWTAGEDRMHTRLRYERGAAGWGVGRCIAP